MLGVPEPALATSTENCQALAWDTATEPALLFHSRFRGGSAVAPGRGGVTSGCSPRTQHWSPPARTPPNLAPPCCTKQLRRHRPIILFDTNCLCITTNKWSGQSADSTCQHLRHATHVTRDAIHGIHGTCVSDPTADPARKVWPRRRLNLNQRSGQSARVNLPTLARHAAHVTHDTRHGTHDTRVTLPHTLQYGYSTRHMQHAWCKTWNT